MTELPLAANIDRNWARERIIGLQEQVAYYRGVCEEQALTIHIHEKGGGEQAATIRTRDKRIAELEAALRGVGDFAGTWIRNCSCDRCKAWREAGRVLAL